MTKQRKVALKKIRKISFDEGWNYGWKDGHKMGLSDGKKSIEQERIKTNIELARQLGQYTQQFSNMTENLSKMWMVFFGEGGVRS